MELEIVKMLKLLREERFIDGCCVCVCVCMFCSFVFKVGIKAKQRKILNIYYFRGKFIMINVQRKI